MTRNWHLIYSEPFGRNHRLFQDETGAISICDESGDHPDLTDDGPLIVVPDQVISVETDSVRPVQCRVGVLVTRTGQSACCWVSARIAIQLLKLIPGIEVELNAQAEILRGWLNKLAEK